MSVDDVLIHVGAAVAHRLVRMGQTVSPVSHDDLVRDFDRQTAVRGVHYRIELSGTPCLYSVWAVQGWKSPAVDAINREIVVLGERGRIIASSLVGVDGVQLITETLGAAERNPALPFAVRKLTETFWDQETLTLLYERMYAKSSTPPREGKGG